MTMKCPVCGAAELIHDTRDIPYRYKGKTTILTTTGDFCPACGESIHDMEDSERVMRGMQAFSKQVNADLVDPAFIVKVRKKLALDQREAAEIFGGGVNAFSRYENGKTKPSLALVKLLRVLTSTPISWTKYAPRRASCSAWDCRHPAYRLTWRSTSSAISSMNACCRSGAKRNSTMGVKNRFSTMEGIFIPSSADDEKSRVTR